MARNGTLTTFVNFKHMGVLRVVILSIWERIMVETYIGDMIFDRCILLVNNSRNAWDWRSLSREWRREDFWPVCDNVASGWRYAQVRT